MELPEAPEPFLDPYALEANLMRVPSGQDAAAHRGLDQEVRRFSRDLVFSGRERALVIIPTVLAQASVGKPTLVTMRITALARAEDALWEPSELRTRFTTALAAVPTAEEWMVTRTSVQLMSHLLAGRDMHLRGAIGGFDGDGPIR